jgi:hypothetical protein
MIWTITRRSGAGIAGSSPKERNRAQTHNGEPRGSPLLDSYLGSNLAPAMLGMPENRHAQSWHKNLGTDQIYELLQPE